MLVRLIVACALVSDTDLAARMDLDGDGFSRPDDCDDGDPSVGNGDRWYADADGDGFGTTSASTACAQPDGFAPETGDCDDSRPEVHPAAVEVCNGLDDDCSGQIDGADASDAVAWYPDEDTDGYGAGGAAEMACEAPELGWLTTPGDCDDSNANAYPGNTEVWYDGLDGDCLGGDDNDADGDGFADLDHGGADCNDTDLWVNPDRPEACGDGVDNDCDGIKLDCAWEGALSLDAAGAVLGFDDQDAFGFALADVGDTNGDGHDALVVGAPERSAEGSNAGSAWLFADIPEGTQTADGPGLWINGASSNGHFGHAIAAAGDQDEDGFADFWVTAPYQLGPAPDYLSNVGAVFLVHGPVSASQTIDADAAGFFGARPRFGLGWNVASADLDDDGLFEMVASYASNDGTADDYSQGGIIVWRGGVDGVHLDTDGVRLDGDGDADFAGSLGLAAGGDLDGDGFGDVAVGAPHDYGAEQPGLIYVVNGPALEAGELADVGIALTGADDGDFAGCALSFPGDLDGDGYGELLVSAPYLVYGAVFVLHGPVSAGNLDDIPDRVIGTYSSRTIGVTFDAGADVNGDDRNDILIRAQGCKGCDSEAIAFLLLSPVEGIAVADRDELASVLVPSVSSTTSGPAILIDDMTGDGRADMVIADRTHVEGDEMPGVVYFLAGAAP